MIHKWIPSLTFGGVLLIGGLAAVWWHVRTWRARQQDETLADAERGHYRRQHCRRLQTSGIIALLGVLFPIGDQNGLVPWEEHPLAWGVYWFVVLGLTFWVMLLAMGDIVATQRHSRAALGRLEAQRRALEREAARLRGQSSNGPRGV